MSKDGFEGFTRSGKKVGGTPSENPLEGIYTKDGHKYLIKQDVRRGKVQSNKNIAEFLSSRIFATTAPGSSAEVSLVRSGGAHEGGDWTGDDVYVASKFFDNYKDLYVEIYESAGKEAPKSLPGFAVPGVDTPLLSNGFKNNKYKDFAKVMVTSLLVGDRDMHWGNVGVVDGERLVRIDMGWAFDGISEEGLDPNQFKFHGIFDGRPFNRFRDYPDELKYNEEFTQELRRVANIDLKETIEVATNELKEHYGIEPLKEFAKYIGVSDKMLSASQDVDSVIGHIQKHLTTQLERRKQNLIQIANEIDLGLCVDPKTKEIDQKKLAKFYQTNKEFCDKNLVESHGNFKIKTKLPFFYNVLEWLGIYSLRSEITNKIKKEVGKIKEASMALSNSVTTAEKWVDKTARTLGRRGREGFHGR